MTAHSERLMAEPPDSNVVRLEVKRPCFAPGVRCHTCGNPPPTAERAWADGWRIHVLSLGMLICPSCADALPEDDLR